MRTQAELQSYRSRDVFEAVNRQFQLGIETDLGILIKISVTDAIAGKISTTSTWSDDNKVYFEDADWIYDEEYFEFKEI